MEKEKVTKEIVNEKLALLVDCFAPRSEMFFKNLGNRILQKGYTEDELHKGIDTVVDTCEYSKLSIAAVIQAIEKPKSMSDIIREANIQGSR
jgi:hypothetical protein